MELLRRLPAVAEPTTTADTTNGTNDSSTINNDNESKFSLKYQQDTNAIQAVACRPSLRVCSNKNLFRKKEKCEMESRSHRACTCEVAIYSMIERIN
mmetsp:Transcript_18101/g.21653  ORF Transcript_18101/g.21653 Transcript_18101/m.21653 type:complete len:97 (-) Transcript_18101:64-354(-)